MDDDFDFYKYLRDFIAKQPDDEVGLHNKKVMGIIENDNKLRKD